MTKWKKPTPTQLKRIIKEYLNLDYTDSTKILIKIKEARPEWSIDLGEFSQVFKKLKEKQESKDGRGQSIRLYCKNHKQNSYWRSAVYCFMYIE